jgi:hypothetical protein
VRELWDVHHARLRRAKVASDRSDWYRINMEQCNRYQEEAGDPIDLRVVLPDAPKR